MSSSAGEGRGKELQGLERGSATARPGPDILSGWARLADMNQERFWGEHVRV